MRPVLLALVAAAAAVGLGWTALGYEADRCRLPSEPPRKLDLSNPSDARHLARDLARVERIAERYRDAVRRRPPVGDGADLQRYLPLRPDRAYFYCTTILKEQIARTHGLQKAAGREANP